MNTSEKYVIGALINDARSHNLMADLSEHDFTVPELRDIFRTITRLAPQPLDLVVMDTETKGNLTELLIEVTSLAVSPVLAPFHAGKVKEASVRRQLSSLAEGLFKDMGDPSVELEASLNAVKRRLNDISTGKRHEWTSASDLARTTFDWLERLHQGSVKPIGTGITDMDRLIGGLYPGELTVVGAKPGTGKTVFGMLAALSAAKSGARVGVLNLEMLDSQYGSRIVSNLGRVDAMKLRRGDLDPQDWDSVMRAIGELSKLPASFMFNTRHIEDLVNAVQDIDLLVVDYLQLLRTRQAFESERLRMAHISWMLKELAVDKKIPIIAMSQLRRPDSGAADKMPSMRDLRESGNLEADADGIILMHEPASDKDPYVYRDDKPNLEAWQKQGLRYICLKVEKQRQGAVGTIPVLFDANRMRYIGIERGRK